MENIRTFLRTQNILKCFLKKENKKKILFRKYFILECVLIAVVVFLISLTAFVHF